MRCTQQTQAIDDAYRSVSDCDDAEKLDEGKKIVEELAKLKYEVQHDRTMTYVFSRIMSVLGWGVGFLVFPLALALDLSSGSLFGRSPVGL